MNVDRRQTDSSMDTDGRADRLPVSPEIRKEIFEATDQQDLAKDRPSWQRAVARVDRPLVGKPAQPRFNRKITGGYRHEIRSDGDLEGTAGIQSFGRSTKLGPENALHNSVRARAPSPTPTKLFLEDS